MVREPPVQRRRRRRDVGARGRAVGRARASSWCSARSASGSSRVPATSTTDRRASASRIARRGELVRRVPPSVFWPRPTVASVARAAGAARRAAGRRRARAALARRRRRVRRAPQDDAERGASGSGVDPGRADDLLTEAGIDPRARAERLSLAEFARIAEAAAVTRVAAIGRRGTRPRSSTSSCACSARARTATTSSRAWCVPLSLADARDRDARPQKLDVVRRRVRDRAVRGPGRGRHEPRARRGARASARRARPMPAAPRSRIDEADPGRGGARRRERRRGRDAPRAERAVGRAAWIATRSLTIGERIGSDVPAMLAGRPGADARARRADRAGPTSLHDVVGRRAVRLPDALARRVPVVGRGRRRAPGPDPGAPDRRGRDRATSSCSGTLLFNDLEEPVVAPAPRDRRGEAAPARGGRARRRHERERVRRSVARSARAHGLTARPAGRRPVPGLLRRRRGPPAG